VAQQLNSIQFFLNMSTDNNNNNNNNNSNSAESVYDDAASDQSLLRKQREIAGLLAWGNTFLSKRQLTSNSLFSFDDGVLLINLLEIAFNDTLPKYHNRPKLPFHKLENISIAFDYMKSLGIDIVSVDANDLLSRRDKAIIIVLWNILRFHVLGAMKQDAKDKVAKQQPIRERLLAWCSQQNIPIKDFW
jgi:hypothetical protein